MAFKAGGYRVTETTKPSKHVEPDLRQIILDVASTSDHPMVKEALEHLLVATQLVHGEIISAKYEDVKLYLKRKKQADEDYWNDGIAETGILPGSLWSKISRTIKGR